MPLGWDTWDIFGRGPKVFVDYGIYHMYGVGKLGKVAGVGGVSSPRIGV